MSALTVQKTDQILLFTARLSQASIMLCMLSVAVIWQLELCFYRAGAHARATSAQHGDATRCAQTHVLDRSVFCNSARLQHAHITVAIVTASALHCTAWYTHFVDSFNSAEIRTVVCQGLTMMLDSNLGALWSMLPGVCQFMLLSLQVTWLLSWADVYVPANIAVCAVCECSACVHCTATVQHTYKHTCIVAAGDQCATAWRCGSLQSFKARSRTADLSITVQERSSSLMSSIRWTCPLLTGPGRECSTWSRRVLDQLVEHVSSSTCIFFTSTLW
jgi:hypothetical protein